MDLPLNEPARVPLACLPTPLVRLPRLSAELAAEIWVKRDDLTGLELSGNKVRKLEYIAAAAIAAGCDTLLTEGTPQSNHCRATAAACARLGLHCHLLLRPAPEGMAGNLLLDRLFGATWEGCPAAEFYANHERLVAAALERLRAAGRSPRFTPVGGSEPLGCWGYLRAAAELGLQLGERGMAEADLVVAMSSGGTAAGLLLGRLLGFLPGVTLWLAPVSDDAGRQARLLEDLCRRTIATYSLPVDFDAAAVRFLDGYVGAGYAIPYREASEALVLVAQREALLLDPVYTAKAFTAMIDTVRAGGLGRSRPVIFVHTGGAFSNFAWPELLEHAGSLPSRAASG